MRTRLNRFDGFFPLHSLKNKIIYNIKYKPSRTLATTLCFSLLSTFQCGGELPVRQLFNRSGHHQSAPVCLRQGGPLYLRIVKLSGFYLSIVAPATSTLGAALCDRYRRRIVVRYAPATDVFMYEYIHANKRTAFCILRARPPVGAHIFSTQFEYEHNVHYAELPYFYYNS